MRHFLLKAATSTSIGLIILLSGVRVVFAQNTLDNAVPTVKTDLLLEDSSDSTTQDESDHSSNNPLDLKDDDFIFDDALFNPKRSQVEQLKKLSTHPSIAAGEYRVDIYLNQKFLMQKNIHFVPAHASVMPCLDADVVQQAELIVNVGIDLQQAQHCFSLDQLISSGRSHFDFAKMRLDLNVPDSKIKRLPLGLVPQNEWQGGDKIGFINYIAHYFHHSYNTAQLSSRSDSGFISLQGGLNIGTWQYRQQSSLSLNHSKAQWQTLNQYFKKPLPALHSELAIGQLNSSGRFFSGMRFEGIRLNSDERMLAPVFRSYAPVIHGMAKTQAHVTISQFGRIIYQTTVAPGAFEINDLSAVQGEGELSVHVEEADQNSHSFVVPYYANNSALRAGNYKYHLDLGRARDVSSPQYFANFSGQYGLNNLMGLSAGMSLAHHYQGLVLGNSLSAAWGILNTDLSFSNAQLDRTSNQGLAALQLKQQGWLISSQFSRHLAAQHRSILIHLMYFPKSGFRSLSDHVMLRDAYHQISQQEHSPATGQSNKQSAHYPALQNAYQNLQPNAEQFRLRMSLNQSLGKYGHTYLTTALHQYRDQRPNVYQFQLGYSTQLSRNLSFNLNLSQFKSRQSAANNVADSANTPLLDQSSNTGLSVAMSFTLAMNQRQYLPRQYSLSNIYADKTNSTQLSLSGQLDQDASLNYQLGAYTQSNTQQYSWNAALQKQWSALNLDLNTTMGTEFWQASVGAQGALALHAGGLTFGSYLSDTFALIEAPGAAGAELLNARGAVINKRGYALLPTMTPYQYNTVTLNPIGMAQHTELENGTQRVVPYAGSALKLKFNTRQGYAMLLQSSLANGTNIPFGTEVFEGTTANSDAQSIGMVGQLGQIYLRAQQPQGRLTLRWGATAQQACHIDYALSPNQIKAALIRLTAPCTFSTE